MFLPPSHPTITLSNFDTYVYRTSLKEQHNMPSVRYYKYASPPTNPCEGHGLTRPSQTAPFWDFVASLEDQGAQHPLFGSRAEGHDDNQRPHPWAGPFGGWPFGQVPHRGPPGPPPPPAPPAHGHEGPDHPPPPPPEYSDNDGPQPGPSEPRGHRHHHRGPSARRGRHGGPRGCHERGGGGIGGRGFFPHAGPTPPFAHPLAQLFQSQLFGGATGDHEGDNDNAKTDDFRPEADVFDTPDAFVVHVSLPGAKKEDVGVSWDAERSELAIAGVIYRAGDEEFLKTLALNERSVGAFERKVRLGSRANPAQVDVDAITAKMEDGVLSVEVPKLDSGYVEIKKVDIE